MPDAFGDIMHKSLKNLQHSCILRWCEEGDYVLVHRRHNNNGGQEQVGTTEGATQQNRFDS